MRKAIKILGLFDLLVVVFYVGYFALNAPTIVKAVENKLSPIKDSYNTTNAVADIIKLPTASASSDDNNGSASKQNSEVVEFKAKFKNDWLYYPKLGIEAPVEWDVQTQNVKKLLVNELVHISGTGKPDTSGEALIAGHSSYYWWSDGKYKNIFAPLVKSAESDYIIVKVKDRVYIYAVKDSKQVSSSTELEMKVGSTSQKKLFLLTCVPIGTNLKRLIVEADLVREI